MKANVPYILIGVLLLTVAACGRRNPDVPLRKPEASAPQPLHYHALVIGIGDYSGTGWPNLGTARADAESLGSTLETSYGFSVTALTDERANRGNILRTLDQYMNLTDNDALLIFFAGHGYYDKKMDEGYWIPYGAQRWRMNLPAKEDWLWNSSINRVLSALPARHVLLIADTCYGGSLFRGANEPVKSGSWYQRAMTVPSRYLITSGNLEPVLDSGIRHSVFTQEILNYLQFNEHNIFSASDVAIAIRGKVSELTGQLVRMGPLTSPANAGGEFVFVRNETEPPYMPALTNFEQQADPLSVNETRGTLDRLASRIENYSRKTPKNAFVRPRVLACLGPGGDSEEASMVRNRLFKDLNSIGGCILVEREAFDTLLGEIELGRSGLADSRAATEIGKLLPASLILFGEIIPIGNQQEIHLRIVDTETSRILSSTSAMFKGYDEIDRICQTLSEQIMETVNSARPLLLEARYTHDGMLSAGWGRFHGGRIGDTFEIITREAVGTVSQREIPLGTARISTLDEESSEFQPDWNETITNPPANLWLKASL